MNEDRSPYFTERVTPEDAESGFRCGEHKLDHFFKEHAVANEHAGIGRTYVLRRGEGEGPEIPRVLGFYTLSMADVDAAKVGPVLKQKLPGYPMPVALIGRLAVDRRVHGRRLGERLLIDALRRIVDAAAILGCIGVIVDAKNEGAERFYEKYDFITVHAEKWPHRMFLPIEVAKAAFADQ